MSGALLNATAKPRPPLPPFPEVSLNAWRFDSENWLRNTRQAPLAFENVQVVESWSGYALRLAGRQGALLALPRRSPDGQLNLLETAGSIRFWFSPDWTSAPEGTGPGTEARLLEIGAWSETAAQGWWALSVNSAGTALQFVAQGAARSVAILEARIHWCAGEWHQVALTWSLDGQTVLFLDGQAVAEGPGVSLEPLTTFDGVRGFCLGSDVQGSSLAQGTFDEFYTFGYPCTTEELAQNYRFTAPYAALSPLAGNTLTESSSPPEPGGQPGGGGGGLPITPPDYGCGLWLSISNVSTNTVSLTLHNTRPGTNYEVLSKTNLALTSWTTETNVTGTSGQDFTQVSIPKLQRPHLFLMASETRDYATNKTFAGLDQSNSAFLVPDAMGAAGTNHFIQLLNGVIAVFDKNTYTKIASTASSNFFAVSYQGTNFPTGPATIDPRILYDQQSGRWIAAAIDVFGSRQAILAVSTNASPTNLLSNWKKYLIPMAVSGSDSDFLTMGLDANGIYLRVLHRDSATNSGHTIVAIKKPEIYSGTIISNRFEIDTNSPTTNVWTIQPAVNFDPVPTNGYAWLVAKGPPQLGTNYRGGGILYRRLRWTNNAALLVDTNWQVMPDPPNLDYRNYYDLDGTNLTVAPLGATGVGAPQAGGTNRIDLHVTGSRLMNAVIRGGFLYTCQHVGLNGTNGMYSGNETGTNVDRTAIQWLRLRVDPVGNSLSYYNHGRIYNSAASNPWYYYFPSVMANCAGDIALGFSGSSATNYIGAFYNWRPFSGDFNGPSRLIKTGQDYYEVSNFGDYSATCLDPTDNFTFWTVQAFANVNTIGWGTWIANMARY